MRLCVPSRHNFIEHLVIFSLVNILEWISITLNNLYFNIS